MLATVFFILPCLFYIRVFLLQYGYIKYSTVVLQILATRAALSLPLYSLIMYISFWFPQSFGALQFAVSVIEAYSLICFLAMVVENFASPEACVVQLKRMNRKPFCWCFCFSDDMGVFFASVKAALYRLLSVRLLLVAGGVVASYLEAPRVAALCDLLAFVLMVHGVVSLVCLCESPPLSQLCVCRPMLADSGVCCVVVA